MDYRAKHKRYQRRKKGAKAAKLLRILGGIAIVIGLILVVGSVGYSECLGPIKVALENATKGIALLINGAAINGAAWAVEALTC